MCICMGILYVLVTRVLIVHNAHVHCTYSTFYQSKCTCIHVTRVIPSLLKFMLPELDYTGACSVQHVTRISGMLYTVYFEGKWCNRNVHTVIAQ